LALANSCGNDNTATGYIAMIGDDDFTCVYGSHNTATGSEALHWLTGGNNNTATGASAMRGEDFTDIYGSNNTATGFEALNSIFIGSNNTANGVQVLFNNIDGNNNTVAATSPSMRTRRVSIIPPMV
jgi:trimeric autotransporter adhesin